MNEHGLPLTRRSLIAGMGVAAGAAVWPVPASATDVAGAAGAAGVAGAAGGAPLDAGRQGPFGGLYSTKLQYTSLPAVSFRPAISSTAYTAANGTLTGTGEFLVPLSPSVGDGLREFDVVVDSGGQTGLVTVTRYPFYTAGAPEVLGTGNYTAATGRQTVVVHLEHEADPAFSNYVASVALQPGVVLHGANLWFFPLAAGLVMIPPQRSYDSRTADGKITSGESRAVELALDANTPVALINLTLDQTEDRGFLTLFGSVGEDGSPPPATSSINWYGPNQIVANLAIVRLGGGNAVSVVAGGPGRTHFLIDVLGYFA